ncbi:hypothetical protein [Nonomuraea jabiensis]|uniref:Tetratricopeptide repeat protein n=1 Tax=Nonomuraea jabiensis TaxID=882448 RepID=A0A7W9GGE0_9ACTN|nr:hypothetical protein [Nonomuraea jabiensis]MBB5783347.1 hypothetical protein [Nonomuraea jabiensis]
MSAHRLAQALTDIGKGHSQDDESTLAEGLAAFRGAADAWRAWSAVADQPAGFQERAITLLYLSQELRVNGGGRQKDEIADVDQEIVEVYRILAEEEPYGFEGSLAIALTNSSISLARAGRGEEAVDALRDASASCPAGTASTRLAGPAFEAPSRGRT